MSAQVPRRGAHGRLAAWLLKLYPASWRARYEGEVLALIEEDPPSAGGLLSLLRGAADAHVQPRAGWRSALAPAERGALSLCGLFACWIVLSMLGIGFQKETEETAFATAAAHHTILLLARDMIVAGAALGAGAIAFGGLPLLLHATRRALKTRDRRLVLALVAPPLAVVAFGALTRLLIAVAPSRGGGFPLSFVLEIMVPWQLTALLCGCVCAFAPRVALRRASPSQRSLRRAARSSVGLLLASALLAAGLATYTIALWLQAPTLSHVASGPIGASTGAMLSVEALVALGAIALAVCAAGRARRALAVG